MAYLTLLGETPIQKSDFSRFDELSTLHNETGWGDYTDSQYTQGSPFLVSADTDTMLPNDGQGAFSRRFEEPADIAPFPCGWLDDNKIRGRDGDALMITTSCTLLPTSASTTDLELWYDIGGGVGELYRRIAGFPKGNGVVRSFTVSTLVYTLDTWEENGATTYVRSNGPVSIYNIRHVVGRVHSRRLGRVAAAELGLS